MPSALIVDDEADARSVLKKILELFCPQVTDIDEAANGRDALRLASGTAYDLAFIDIKLKNENGIDLAKGISNYCNNIVFVTAFDEYAVRAFQTEAIHFLLKPVDPELLQQAVARGLAGNYRLNLLKDRLFLRTKERINVLKYEEIQYIVGDGNYATFHTTNGGSLMVSRNLAYYEKLIDSPVFARSHQSYLIHLQFISEIMVANHLVIMDDGTKIPISRRLRDPFVKAFMQLK
ncbi:LytR/AlgR family response regulator transcription factor [Neolewinella persica]|uniref:LytR/AlgR family response regulator transcription factor n=1 Tax=Neolewinella persica TaxID=70998 RepID=UPI0003757F22|nr:LytTR family DNA-binding domain-containing protein [Neolewinella persica]